MGLGRSLGYVIGGLEVVVGLALIALGGPAAIGVPLVISGEATMLGAALTSAPKNTRRKTMRESPAYGVDQFENPRGPEAQIPILYGRHRIKPVVIAESVAAIAENNVPGVDAQRRQAVKWLGVICEGEIESVEDVEINDRKALDDPRTGVAVGTGNGTKKDFVLPARWIYLGGDEDPAVKVYVDGVLKSYSTKHASVELTMPSSTVRVFDVQRSDRRERLLEATLRVYVRGPGQAEFEQLRRVGVFKWTLQKLAPWKARLVFRTRPPAGWTARVVYDYLGTEGLAIVQNALGATTVVFGTAPAAGKRIAADFRTTQFHGLRLQWRPGTLDQAPIEGFTDLEQSRNPVEQTLVQNAAVSYSTSGREVDNLRFAVAAPRGFIRYRNEGGSDPVLARIKIEYRKIGSASWTTLRCASGTSFTLASERASTERWEIDLRNEWQKLFVGGDDDAADKLAAFDRGAYEARMTRLTPSSSDSLVIDDLSFAYVTEVLHEGFTYPGSALLAIQAMPSEALTGNSLRVSCVPRRGKLFDPRPVVEGNDAFDFNSSQNAALAILDLVTSSQGVAAERFGAGRFFTVADFFSPTQGLLNGLAQFANFCDAWVHKPGADTSQPASAINGERRCRLNIVLDTPQSVMETVADIAFLGWCLVSLQGARWRFPLDQDGESVRTFDEIDPHGNAWDVSVKLEEWGKSPTGVMGVFWNEAMRYERDQLLVPVDGVAETAPPNQRDVDLRGCTSESEAARLLRHLAAQAAAAPHPCTWRAAAGEQRVEAGDIVTLRTRVPWATGPKATSLKVRVLAAMVGRDEDGKVSVRYAGRVMASSVYKLQSATVPPNHAALAAQVSQRRVLTSLKARVA
jgi:hypothetical protein